MRYSLTKADFDQVFDFAVRYHLEPKKSGSTRTSGANRGLGGVLDSFVRGKLVEIGVVKILESLGEPKGLKLDFDIKPTNEVGREPDIVEVIEKNFSRKPKVFVEIKNVGKADRWVGLTKEQLKSCKKFNNGNGVYIIGASLNNLEEGKNDKEKDFVGSYLKEITKNGLFKSFAHLSFSEVSIEYAISGAQLDSFGVIFPKDSCLYETEVFAEAGQFDKTRVILGKYQKIGVLKDGDFIEPYKVSEYPAPPFGNFKVSGELEVFKKTNSKSRVFFLLSKKNVRITNGMLGEFNLLKNKVYSFKTGTLGRNPKLDRDNVWMAKRNIPRLISESKIPSAVEACKLICRNI